MKRLLFTLTIILISVCSFSQTVRLYQSVSDYYKVYTDVSEEYAQEIVNQMEAALVLFNEILHFDLTELEIKFKVSIYKNKTGFDTYLKRLLGQTRDDFVYIHYTDLRKSELVAFQKDDENDMISSLLHQGFIQFIKTFIPNVPIWMSEGIAAYLENSAYVSNVSMTESEKKESAEETGKGHFILNKSLIWLDSLKALLKGETSNSVLPLAELLTIKKDSAVKLIDVFYPQSWGLVYFLLNSSDKEYNRLFWESIYILDPSKSLADNSKAVKDLVFKWKEPDTFYSEFKAYILSLKTFNDYVTEGLKYYDDKKLKEAEASFKKALDIKPSHYFPLYYMGLIAYANKDYFSAEEYYLQALEYGADIGLTYYALGVNAYADNQYDNAIAYLNGSVDEDPDKYKDKVDFILQRIESEKLDEDMYMDYDSDTDDLDLEPDTKAFDKEDEYNEDDKEDVYDEDDKSDKGDTLDGDDDDFDDDEYYEDEGEYDEFDEFDDYSGA